MIEAAKLVRKRNAIKSYFLMIAEVKSLRRLKRHIQVVVIQVNIILILLLTKRIVNEIF